MQPLPTMQESTVNSLPTMQLLPPCEQSDNEQLETDDEFDHPRGLGRAETRGGCAPEDPPENAQDSAWAGPGAAQLAPRERPPARAASGAPPLHGGAGAAPTSAPGMPPRSAAGAAPAGRSRQAEPARAGGGAAPGAGLAAQAGRPICGGRAGASGGKLAAASRALEMQRARILELEQLQAKLQQEVQEARQRILQQEADLTELELQQDEPVARALVPMEKAAPVAPGAPAITTLVIRNLPMAVTQGDLLVLMNQSGYANRYDFAYAPTDFHARTTKGHAFVNFITPSDALEFIAEWNGSRLAMAGPAAPVLEVMAAQLQGYEENARRWSARRLRRTKNPELHPFFAQR
ncbi:unnamed protein product [Prorocentrum cordatum]|uniref:RRM domain-containing protein n=1 Tax=Prorocentrum cordatum TaxID=2364126 RepID=A0ABN9VEX5_9DINO|nr:unnamed protein product [Polarella glacialis]